MLREGKRVPPFEDREREATFRASDRPSAVTAAVRQRETDLIMEALVRECLNCSLRKN